MDLYLVKSILLLRNFLDSGIDSQAKSMAALAYFYASNQGIVKDVDNHIKKEKNK